MLAFLLELIHYLIINQHYSFLYYLPRDYSTHKGVNSRSNGVTQRQQQRHESSTITLIWHASKYTVHKVHQRYTEGVRCTFVGVYVPWLDSHAS